VLVLQTPPAFVFGRLRWTWQLGGEEARKRVRKKTVPTFVGTVFRAA
jgi:hypothetical protein